jgi:hypothetical protein
MVLSRFGCVHFANDIELGIAIKLRCGQVLPSDGVSGTGVGYLDTCRAHFLSFVEEVAIWTRMRSPSVLPLAGVVFDELFSLPQGTISPLANCDLEAYCKARAGSIVPGNIAKIAADMQQGVGYLHQLSPPVVHNNIRLANFLVFEVDTDSPTVLLADFAKSQTLFGDGPWRIHNCFDACELSASVAADAFLLDLHDLGVAICELVLIGVLRKPVYLKQPIAPTDLYEACTVIAQFDEALAARVVDLLSAKLNDFREGFDVARREKVSHLGITFVGPHEAMLCCRRVENRLLCIAQAQYVFRT